MKNILTLGILLLTLIFTSCTKQDEEFGTKEETFQKMSPAESKLFFLRNVSIFDARIRTIDENYFAREVYLKNFSKQNWNETLIEFTGFLFEDLGRGNDLVANDGIFTSVEKFNFNTKVVYNSKQLIRSVMQNPIVSPEFSKNEELQQFSKEYVMKGNIANKTTVGGTATITCDVKIVSSGCIADWVWDGFGCIGVSNCSATVGW
jgi:hypothetical protein